MVTTHRVSPKTWVVLQAVAVYAWLTVLSPLSVTDTYYSVYLLCALAGVLCLFDNYRTQARGPKSLPIFAGLFALAVAAANYPLITPLRVLQNLFDLACLLLGGFAIGGNILLCMVNRLPLPASVEARNHPGRVFWGVFLSVAAIDLGFLFFARYPGILTTDSFATIAQIVGDGPYNNTMPFWHTVTVEPFVELGLLLFDDINAAVACFHVAQILFIASCFGYAIVTMYQMGAPRWVMCAAYFLYALLPHNIAYSVTLWKDIPFAGAALLLVTGLYRLLNDLGRRRGLNYFAFIVGTMGFSLWRTNGWYAFAVMTALMLLLMGKKQKKLLIIMILVTALCWLLIGPVLDLLAVSPTNMVEAFAIPMQQVARVIHNDRYLLDADRAMLAEIFYLDRVKELYDPQTVDPIKFSTFLSHKVDYIKENALEYLLLYIRLGLQYPADYFQAWVEETKGYWNGGYFYWTYTLKFGENDFGLYQTPGDNLIAKGYAALFRYLEKPEILQCVASIGLHAWTLISCGLVAAWQRRKEGLLTVPLLVLLAGLWLGTPVFSEFRYAYPMILSMPMILTATVFRKEE